MRRFVWAWIAFLMAMVNSGWAGEAQWLEVKSPHFSVVTDAGEKRGRDVAVRFEQMRAVFGGLLVKSTVNLPVPLQIVAFRNTKEMRQFAPLWRGKPIELAGLFQYSDDRCFILLDLSTEDPWQVVFHEYGHQLLNGNTSAAVQPWFDEGFAEYFSTIKVNGKEADIGLPPPADVDILRGGGWFKIADLFRVRQNSSTYNESGDHRSMFYAESWLVMHYLYDTQTLPKASDYFRLAIDQQVPIEQAIQKAFGMSSDAFDKALHAYFASGTVKYFKMATPAGIETTGYTVTAMSVPDAKAVLADMHLHSPDYQAKAIGEFEEVLALQPGNFAAMRGLGYAYLRKQNYATAGDYFEKAVKLNGKDPRVLYYSAMLSNQNGMDRDPEKLKRTQHELEASIALDPNFADAYSLLAFTYQAQGRQQDALQSLSKAVALNPRNEAYLYNYAQVLLANQKLNDAVPILERLKTSGNPQIAQMSSSALVQVEAYKAEVAARGQQREGPVMQPRVSSDGMSGEESAPPPIATPASYLKGKLVGVDCASLPSATLTVESGKKTWKMLAKDSSHMVVIGADKFSCDWKNQNVAVNYRETGEASGEVISLELQ